VDVAEDRHLKVGFYGGQHGQSLGQPGAAEGIEGRPVGLVVGGFENIGDAKAVGDCLDFAADHQGAVGVFKDARPGDQGDGVAPAN